MIRQAINCDICAAEKQASNYWFVAYEQGGELKLRGWESPQNSRKNVKHLCGQKCAQRLVANFMASLMSTTHGAEQAKDGMDAAEQGLMMEEIAEPIKIAAQPERSVRARERSDRSLLQATPPVPQLQALSVAPTEVNGDWIGPVRFKDDPWEPVARVRAENPNRVRVQRSM